MSAFSLACSACMRVQVCMHECLCRYVCFVRASVSIFVCKCACVCVCLCAYVLCIACMHALQCVMQYVNDKPV